MTRGRSIRLIVAMLLVAGMGGRSAAAADTPSATVLAQGVRIVVPGGDAISMPAAEIPGTAQVSATTWSSSADQPAVQLGAASSVASLTRKGAIGRVELSGLQLFGGEVTLGSMAFAASHSSRSSGSDLDAEQLVIDGASVSVPAAGAAPVPIGGWGQVTADVSLNDGGSELIGLRVELLVDHGGLPAGSEIQIGVVAFPSITRAGGQQQQQQQQQRTIRRRRSSISRYGTGRTTGRRRGTARRARSTIPATCRGSATAHARAWCGRRPGRSAGRTCGAARAARRVASTARGWLTTHTLRPDIRSLGGPPRRCCGGWESRSHAVTCGRATWRSWGRGRGCRTTSACTPVAAS